MIQKLFGLHEPKLIQNSKNPRFNWIAICLWMKVNFARVLHSHERKTIKLHLLCISFDSPSSPIFNIVWNLSVHQSFTCHTFLCNLDTYSCLHCCSLVQNVWIEKNRTIFVWKSKNQPTRSTYSGVRVIFCHWSKNCSFFVQHLSPNLKWDSIHCNRVFFPHDSLTLNLFL